MLKKLVGSRIRINILKLFIFNPKKEYYVRETERLTGEAFDPVRRELIRLESIGLLKSRISGRQKYYSVNPDHSIFPEVKSMILKTVGMGDTIKSAVEHRKDIQTAFIYGSYAKNTEDLESDIDLFVVGNILSKEIQEVVSGIEGRTKREINTTVYSAEELQEKYKTKNHFISMVLKEPKIFLKGDEDGLRKLVSGRKLVKHRPLKEELLAIFGVVERNIRDANVKGLSVDQKYILSYQAAFEAALALVKCQGYRPLKAGHHYIVWQCMKDILGEESRKAILLFEDAAKKRNKLSYDIAGIASHKEADEMFQEACDFVTFLKEEIKKFNIA